MSTFGEKLGYAFLASQVFEKLEMAFDRHVERKRRAREDDKDRKIRDLEDRLAQLEALVERPER